MISTLTFLYYVWGFINSLLIAKTITYGKEFASMKETHPDYFSEKSNSMIKHYSSCFFWCVIGLISSQWLWFAGYLLFVYLLRLTTKGRLNWIDNPNWFNVNFNRLLRFIHFILILFPVINHFHLHIPISEIITNLIK